MKRVALVASMLTLGSVATVAVASPATQDPVAVGKNGMKMGTSYQNDVSLPLYYLPSREIDEDADHKEGPANPFIDSNHQDSPDPVIQHTRGPNPLVPAPILSFNGIQFPGVGCSCAPPDTNGEVGETQDHHLVLLEGLSRVRVIVLRAGGKQDTGFLQALHMFLERMKGLAFGAAANGDAVSAQLTHDTAPQGVVEIEHEHLLAPGGEHAQTHGHLAREHGETFR
jgi:hypothetical protein